MRRWMLCETEPSIEELLSDDIMVLVMRRSGVSAEELRAMLRRTASRIARRSCNEGANVTCAASA